MDQMDPVIESSLVASISGVPAQTVRNWAHRDLLLADEYTPPGTGGPRRWPWLAVVEITIAAHLARAGVPIETASRAFRARIEAAGHRAMAARTPGTQAYWAVEAIRAALPDLTELRDPDAFWIVTPDRVTAVRRDDLGAAIADPACIVIAVGALVQDVNDQLRGAGFDV